jgi:hypothetical protein
MSQSLQTWDKLRADLFAHLNTLAKIDGLMIKYGQFSRNYPIQGRQLVAFAMTPVSEASIFS